uniref:Transposase n=1 Tax=Panagrolaimus sp. PS1159 TaxID=55785 RepID=A0AC35GP65_9BILA
MLLNPNAATRNQRPAGLSASESDQPSRFNQRKLVSLYNNLKKDKKEAERKIEDMDVDNLSETEEENNWNFTEGDNDFDESFGDLHNESTDNLDATFNWTCSNADETYSGERPFQALFEGSPRSITEFSMFLMAVARRKNLSDAAVIDLLKMHRLMLPVENAVPQTYETLKRLVTHESKSNLVVATTVFCSNCLKEVCDCGHLEKAMHLKYDLYPQLEELYSKHGAVMFEYRKHMLSKIDHRDIHQGDCYREAVSKNPNMIPIGIYTDGARYTKSGGYEAWPLLGFALDLPLKLRHKYSNILYLSLWYGKTKPNWKFIFDKMKPLRPFVYEGQAYRIKIFQAVADIPARQSWLSMTNVPGYDTCYICDIHGEHVSELKKIIFPYIETHPRSRDTFINHFAGVKGDSELRNMLEKFPQSVVIDVMHSVYRGPVEDDIKMLLKGLRRDQNQWSLIKLSSNGFIKLDTFLTKYF